MYASVVVDVVASNVDRLYTYAIPPFFVEVLEVGMRVNVPFGGGDKLILGYVLEINEQAPKNVTDIKAINEVLDLEPLISFEQLELAYYVKKQTFAPLVSILNLMIPSNLRLKTLRYLEVDDLNNLDANLVLLLQGKTRVLLNAKWNQYQALIKREIQKGYAHIVYATTNRGNKQTEIKYVPNQALIADSIHEIRNPIWRDFLVDFATEKSYMRPMDILEKYYITTYGFKKLVERNYILTKEFPVSRIKKRQIVYSKRLSELNAKTNDVRFGEIQKQISSATKPILWIPKNQQEIDYTILRIIERNLAEGLKTIIFVPDILSSYQYASLIEMASGLQVACLSSNLSANEYQDYYDAIRADEYSVIVTTTVGAFLPYANIGTVLIMDQESTNYQSERSPRYDLNELYRYLAAQNHFQLIYETIVPELTIYSEAIRDHLVFVHDAAEKPKNIKIIDLKDEMRGGNLLPVSQHLIDGLKENIIKGKVSLLVLNNKGYSDFVMCRDCGMVALCPKCGVSYKYQESKNRLYCTNCGNSEAFVAECKVCHKPNLKHFGIGMEQLETLLLNEIPHARIVRFDDASFNTFEQKMQLLQEHAVDIVIASDVYGRSIASDDITLVGIINLDMTTKSASYLANHFGYSLLEHAFWHVNKPNCQMVVQTYHPDADLLKAFVLDDYQLFFNNEMVMRDTMHLPPLYTVNRLLIKANYPDNYKVANFIKKALIARNVFIVGPTYNQKNQAVQLIIKYQDQTVFNKYQKIYQTYQTNDTLLTLECYPKNIY